MNFIPTKCHKIALIMAGGHGMRFWPRSRRARPKQFLNILEDKTLLEQTVQRLKGYFNFNDIFILTTKALAEETSKICPDIPVENIIIEPEGRNTAPCLALALVVIEQLVSNGVMVVLSADAWIGDNAKFYEDLNIAINCAINEHMLVTFGIHPTYPETGYGYIEAEGNETSIKVKAFCEKPNLKKAIEYVQSGRYYWNAGIFIWTVNDFRLQLLEHCPNIIKPLDDWATSGAKSEQLVQTYGSLPKKSIDYALMEKSDRVVVVPASFRWSDVGSWSAILDFYEADGLGNIGVGDNVLIKSNNCAIFSNKRVVAGVGISNLIIVDEPDALLICHKDSAQDVKLVVDRLKTLGREDLI